MQTRHDGHPCKSPGAYLKAVKEGCKPGGLPGSLHRGSRQRRSLAWTFSLGPTCPQAPSHTDFIFRHISGCYGSPGVGAGIAGDDACETVFVKEQIIFSTCSLLDDVVFWLFLLPHRQRSASA